MFVIKAETVNGNVFYTGGAGSRWVSSEYPDAWKMSRSEAERKATLFNGRTVLTGLTFEVEEC